MKYIVESENTTGEFVITDADQNIIEKVVDGIVKPFTAKDNEIFEKSDLLWTAAEYTTLGFVAGSMLARHRAKQGKEPIAKVFA